ncbi:4Fe-4S dicluster domain-containing protein [Vibrio sp. RC27]
MPISKIDKDLCTGCGKCVESCPMDVIRLDKKKELAVITYVEDCMYCGFCTDCPEGALTVTAGPVRSAILGWG